MKHRFMVTMLFCGCLSLLVGCPWGKGKPKVTITLPAGAKCTGTVTTDVTASITTDSGRAKLTVKVCVLCDGTPLANADGITLKFISEFALPLATLKGTIKLKKTGKGGCVTKSWIIPSSKNLRGQKVNVTVVDSNGVIVSGPEEVGIK